MLDYTSLYCNTTDSDRCFSLPASVSAETGRKAAQMWCKSVSSQNPGAHSSWARCSRRLWALWHLCCVFTAVLSLPWGILKCKKKLHQEHFFYHQDQHYELTSFVGLWVLQTAHRICKPWPNLKPLHSIFISIPTTAECDFTNHTDCRCLTIVQNTPKYLQKGENFTSSSKISRMADSGKRDKKTPWNSWFVLLPTKRKRVHQRATNSREHPNL